MTLTLSAPRGSKLRYVIIGAMLLFGAVLAYLLIAAIRGFISYGRYHSLQTAQLSRLNVITMYMRHPLSTTGALASGHASSIAINPTSLAPGATASSG